MLLPYTGLIYYGVGAAALIDTAPATEPQLDIKADKRLAASVQSGQIQPYLKGTMGKKQTLIVTGLGELATATWKKRGRIALDVSIGASPSAFDIAQAVWLQVASAVNVAGTMGEKLNNSGASSGGLTTEQDAQLMKTLTTGKFIALR